MQRYKKDKGDARDGGEGTRVLKKHGTEQTAGGQLGMAWKRLGYDWGAAEWNGLEWLGSGGVGG